MAAKKNEYVIVDAPAARTAPAPFVFPKAAKPVEVKAEAPKTPEPAKLETKAEAPKEYKEPLRAAPAAAAAAAIRLPEVKRVEPLRAAEPARTAPAAEKKVLWIVEGPGGKLLSVTESQAAADLAMNNFRLEFALESLKIDKETIRRAMEAAPLQQKRKTLADE